MKIALLNVKYSPNLGDGLLSECLERELSAALPGAQVVSIDLAGREIYRDHGASRRGRAIAVLEHLPSWARRHVVRLALTALVRLRLRRHFRDRLTGVDAVVLGGGNLLTDSDLNFPMKISGALAEAARAGLPVAVHAVGVGRDWSAAGHRLFSRALRGVPLIAATVRDDRSRRAWGAALVPEGLPPAEFAGDPGFLASLHFASPRPDRAASAEAPALVGLCVTSPMAIHYHADSPRPSVDYLAWYGKSAAALAKAGYRVALFTNGSPEDRTFLERNAPDWTRDQADAITVVPPFATPDDLVRFIAGCDLVVGHRMHACIAAHSFGIPTIGLKWDVKLESFFALAGRTTFIADCADLDANALTTMAGRALGTRIDTDRLDLLIAATRADVARLATRITAAVKDKRP
ncbi:polysaccharide pyruvyl transferase [Novosphingobium nitrogenifigens DSM 19370]|uniref:Polysaccharide pyruvyl transferase n=1 Tax=Novosphingobium nitrogenifigens DSM 19370 TaxID=983920 RepID=F1Z8I3_9SPHN|nr:polysaccharide pyruvyl transferase family protein [Novosphingobium nitrogenifigens]EGD59042.1 polysaccharide pyruvyl transferase [Novosphingobium nitrogenifigens DSM 19370]